MDDLLKARIADFFEGYELAEFLQLKSEDIVERFEEEILEALDDIEELMNVQH